MGTETRLGKLIVGGANRDAVHIAVAPMMAGTDLRIGQKIKLSYGTTDVAIDGTYFEEQAIGIVDPFLDQYYVREGEKFWCFLFPGSVTNMEHRWQHPAFIEKTVGSEAEAWLRAFSDRWGFYYDDLIEAGVGKDSDWRYVTAHGKDLHGASELEPGEYELFWKHLEDLTGETFSEEHRQGMGWSCTC